MKKANDYSKQGAKNDKIVYITLVLLFVLAAALVLINRSNARTKLREAEDQRFIVYVDGEYAATVSLQMLIDLNPQEFRTSLATSVSAPRDTILLGVELRLLFGALGIDTAGASHFVVSGSDSYYSPLTLSEVESKETIYICFSMDGEILKAQSEGGYGPFLMVVRDSLFAQRWCKYVDSIDMISS